MRSFIKACVPTFVVLIGCSSSPQAPSPEIHEGTPQLLQQTTPSSDAGVGVGNLGASAYVHGIAASKFPVGKGVTEKDEFGMHKFVGDQGVFATRPTGLSLGLTNATAAVRQHPGPLPGGASAHNQAVRDYFVNAGLPADQIGSVDIMPAMSVNADLVNNKQFDPKLEFYFSIIRRQVAGVPVRDSYAWARINLDGAVVDESVYWPQIPPSAIADAKDLTKTLADKVAATNFLSKLPPNKAGQLVIHHTPGEWTGAFEATATYDVPDDNPDFKATIHYNANGQRHIFAHEAKGAWGSSPVMPAKTR